MKRLCLNSIWECRRIVTWAHVREIAYCQGLYANRYGVKNRVELNLRTHCYFHSHWNLQKYGLSVLLRTQHYTLFQQKKCLETSTGLLVWFFHRMAWCMTSVLWCVGFGVWAALDGCAQFGNESLFIASVASNEDYKEFLIRVKTVLYNLKSTSRMLYKGLWQWPGFGHPSVKLCLTSV